MITWVLSGVTPLSLQRARPNSVSSDTMNPEPYICENVCCNPVLLLQPFPEASFGRVPGCLQVPDVQSKLCTDVSLLGLQDLFAQLLETTTIDDPTATLQQLELAR